ncbi:deoxyadenosine/deoxycytidine kinase [Balneicella halophila]|uniref:Deoxyadenosine/deoxycytidine kinase n=1 Tax=Balneicella halophila TaxID=1537566 RepID=A0A7L4UPJ3_BALHA|nr:deoxynucleoside kinase [Balneicella halophila]PVX51051.1 deoxyadenosine/deoxycytidine kinase [Balneicella halophila]
MHIAVAGNIGAGKTTLTELLAKHYGWRAEYEDTVHNPYLSDFYDDMERWSFALQIYFLSSRLEQVLELREKKENVIQDRTIYEDAYIFAPSIASLNMMERRDFENYLSLFEVMSGLVQAPDLLIYLRADVSSLVKNIERRGRDYEKTIRLDYLKELNDRYEEWIHNYKLGKLLIVDVNQINIRDPKNLNQVISKIDAELYGLFNEKNS